MDDVPGAVSRTPRADASMTLLTSMFERPLDPAYAEAAARHEAAGLPRSTPLRTPLLALTALLMGFLLATGAQALRPPVLAGKQAKRSLVAKVEQAQGHNARREARIATLQSEISGLEANALTGPSGTAARTRLDALRVPSATVPVRGAGLVLTIGDPPASANADGSVDPRANGGFGDRITSGDLQIVTNGLWGAGAEAIAINGQRLGSRTAIRFAGQAVLVNYRALQPPYRIEVIGDPDAIERAFRASPSGTYVDDLERTLKAPVSWSRPDAVQLPGDIGTPVLHARPTREGAAK